MVMAIIEPIAAGMIVSLLNKYFVSGQFYNWLQSCCQQVEEEIPEERNRDNEHDDPQWSSTTTTVVSDATVHVHSH